MIQHIVWGVFFVLCFGLGIWEVSRWRDPDLATVITAAHKVRRSVGLALLFAIAVMGYRSADLPMPARGMSTLQANEEFVYYSVMALLVIGVSVVGYLEWKTTLLEVYSERRRTIASVIGATPKPEPESADPHE